MSDNTNVGQHKCWTTQMLDNTNVGQHKCRTTQMSDNTNVGQHKCWTTQMSDNTNVVRHKCGTTQMLDYTICFSCKQASSYFSWNSFVCFTYDRNYFINSTTYVLGSMLWSLFQTFNFH
jgi:hypothetical protein